MRVLIIGGGGREHALAWKLAQSSRVKKIFAAPGNAGISRFAECLDIGADEVIRLRNLAVRAAIDLPVVGPAGPRAARSGAGVDR
mgnify:CR=1 FL=1